MINTSISYDDGILEEDSTYAIGTNDSQKLTVNPSFHTFTITENKGDSNE